MKTKCDVCQPELDDALLLPLPVVLEVLAEGVPQGKEVLWRHHFVVSLGLHVEKLNGLTKSGKKPAYQTVPVTIQLTIMHNQMKSGSKKFSGQENTDQRKIWQIYGQRHQHAPVP